jgi:hypothetical protein
LADCAATIKNEHSSRSLIISSWFLWSAAIFLNYFFTWHN